MDNTNVDLGLVQNVQGLDKLRQMSRGDINDKKDALVAAAQQFESILNQFWLKEMRATNETICPDSPLNSRESSFFQSMLDEQMISSMSNSTTSNSSSLTNLLVRQFAGAMGDEGKEIIAALENSNNISQVYNNGTNNGLVMPTRQDFTGQPNDALVQLNIGHDSSILAQALPLDQTVDSTSLSVRKRNSRAITDSVSKYENVQTEGVVEGSNAMRFVRKFMPIAKRVAEKFGLNPLVIVAQAALETGWGQHVGASNNFFGIKANSSWKGASTLSATTEYINGRKENVKDTFRSYKNAEESFEDYARLITTSQRYATACAQNSDPDRYFEEIQRAGYATDPNYALKLKSIVRNDAFSTYHSSLGDL